MIKIYPKGNLNGCTKFQGNLLNNLPSFTMNSKLNVSLQVEEFCLLKASIFVQPVQHIACNDPNELEIIIF